MGIKYDGRRKMGCSLGHSEGKRINQIKKNFQCAKRIHSYNLLNYQYIDLYSNYFIHYN